MGKPTKTKSLSSATGTDRLAPEKVDAAAADGLRAADLSVNQPDLHDVLEQMSDSYFVLDAAWRVVACNTEYVRLTGIPLHQQLGHDFRDLFLQGTSAEVQRYRQHYQHAFTTRRSFCFVDYYPPLQRWTECRVFPAKEGGIAVFCRDVTEAHTAHLQRLEDRHKLAAIFHTAPAAMALLRGDKFVFEEANERYETLIGGRRVVGRPFDEVFRELPSGLFQQLLRDVMRTGKPYVERESPVRYICRPGGAPEDRIVNFVYARIDDAHNAPYGVMVHVEDVTDNYRAREQLQDSLRARDDFLGFCSHELKNPVAALQLSAQSMERRIKRDATKAISRDHLLELCTKWQRQTERLTRLIDEMADFARLNRGALVLQRASCNLAYIAHEAIERMQVHVQASGSTLTHALDDAVVGLWDALRLEQLCLNLLSNAVKYGDGKPIHLAVTRQDDQAILRVSDHGRGIAPQDHVRVFLPYERASQQHVSGSLGVGLFVCRSIVQAHGGAIELSSVPREGTTFTVRLPLADSSDPQGTANFSPAGILPDKIRSP